MQKDINKVILHLRYKKNNISFNKQTIIYKSVFSLSGFIYK